MWAEVNVAPIVSVEVSQCVCVLHVDFGPRDLLKKAGEWFLLPYWSRQGTNLHPTVHVFGISKRI
jgi:hypothetical protein